jgi:hypothetical protein
MRIVRFGPGADGESTFEALEVLYPHERADAFGHTLALSATVASPTVQFAVLPDGLDQAWHPAPRRQLVAVLSGVVEVGTPDGETRRFGTGDVFLADDVGTRGHTTKTIDGPAHVLFAPVPEGDLWAPAGPARG